jgi:tRNA-dihydrouridine synthase
MLGRGLIANPFLPEMIQSADVTTASRKERFARFHDALVDGYRQRFSGPGHVLDRMKGFWRYLAEGFNDGPNVLKKIRKTRNLISYRRIVAEAIDGIEDGPRRNLFLKPADPC